MELLDNPFGFTLVMEDETGARVMLAEPFKKEPARSDQTDNIRAQLSKLGNTPFEARSVTVRMSENPFVPSSLLADMRRRAVEKLLKAHNIRYGREYARGQKEEMPYPEHSLTYLGNVSNSLAMAFYKAHGVETIDEAFELKPLEDVPLMFSRHCLRFSMGWCPVHQKGKSPFKEPYYLIYKNNRLRLQFDCKQCRMLVYRDSFL